MITSTALFSKFVSKVYLGGDLFLTVLYQYEAYSFVSIMSSINEYKLFTCIWPLLLTRVFNISEAIYFKVFFLEWFSKTLIS